jgi:hypothetical protein
MKVITVLAAAALLFGVTAASAQAPSSGASKPGATTNTDKEVPAVGVKGNEANKTGEAAPNKPLTTGSGGSSATQGSNPNPTSNKNPDPEVPGKKQN